MQNKMTPPGALEGFNASPEADRQQAGCQDKTGFEQLSEEGGGQGDARTSERKAGARAWKDFFVPKRNGNSKQVNKLVRTNDQAKAVLQEIVFNFKRVFFPYHSIIT